MIINHNISALNTYRQLSINNNAGSRSLEKLSSGYRINRAGDDAAGLAISEKMRGQIRGLNMASKNAQDGISLIQTAEGALNETHSILQRMRELAVQAANGTNTDADRAEIQKEIEQLKSEIDRISTDTEFNTKALLDGSIGNTAELVADENNANLAAVEVIDDNLIVTGNYNIKFSDVAVQYVCDNPGNIGVNTVSYNAADDTAFNLAMGTYTLKLVKTDDDTYTLTLTDKATGEVVGTPEEDVTIAPTTTADATATVFGFTLTWNASADAEVNAGSIDITVTADFTATVTGPDGEEIGTTEVTGNTTGIVNVGGFKINFDNSLIDGETIVEAEANAVSFQIGANEGQMTKLVISDMSSEALKVDAIDLTTAESASKAIGIVDEAILKVSSERAKLGAIQNRLEHTINNLGTSAENLTAAESRIRDVDMAKEMMEFYKNSILQQAAQAMLAQANQMPQGVLQLLR